jgi:hypothetical protein
MRRETVLGALTAINMVMLAGIIVTQILPARAQDEPGILRGNGRRRPGAGAFQHFGAAGEGRAG